MLTLLTPRGARSFEAALFDMDGTMADTRELHLDTWGAALEGRTPVPEWREVLARTFGIQGRHVLPHLFRRKLSAGETAEILHKKESLYRDVARGRIRPIPGLMDFVKRAHLAGVRLAMATSAVVDNAELALDEFGLRPYFSSVVHKDRARFGKPDPDTFIIAARDLMARPALCVVFEDAPAGVEAAFRAGMIPVAIDTYPADALDRWAELRVRDFEAVLRRIR